MREATVFKDWQADYAAHGIATFPVSISSDGGKKPLVQYAQPHGCVRDKLHRVHSAAVIVGLIGVGLTFLR